MRVVFDSNPFRYDARTGKGPSGVAKWSLGALSALANLQPEWELVGVSAGKDGPILKASDVGPNVNFVRIPVRRRIHHILELVNLGPAVETWTGRVEAVLGNGFVTARTRHAASLPVIHDMSLVKHPEMHPLKRRAYVATQLNRVIARATVVLTVSETVRGEIAHHYKTPMERIFVAPPSWEPAMFPYQVERVGSPFIQKDLPNSYLLFVGTIEPRKNILGLVTAVGRLRVRRPDTPPLVLVGGQGWGYEVFGEKLEAAIASGAVLKMGYVPDESMQSLYRGALALVYPSLYEGFGMPIVEAMAAGCPVLTSDVPSTAETAGGAALLVDPFDYEQIENAIESLMDDTALRAALIERGLERAKNFSWDQTAANLQEAISLAVEIKAGR